MQRDRKLSGASSYEGIKPITSYHNLMISFNPNYLPKSPFPNTIMLEARASTN